MEILLWELIKAQVVMELIPLLLESLQLGEAAEVPIEWQTDNLEVLEADKVEEVCLTLDQELLDKEMMADLEMTLVVEAEELKLRVDLDHQIMLVELEELEDLFLLIK
mgnify:CR=1 FL=1